MSPAARSRRQTRRRISRRRGSATSANAEGEAAGGSGRAADIADHFSRGRNDLPGKQRPRRGRAAAAPATRLSGKVPRPTRESYGSGRIGREERGTPRPSCGTERAPGGGAAAGG